MKWNNVKKLGLGLVGSGALLVGIGGVAGPAVGVGTGGVLGAGVAMAGTDTVSTAGAVTVTLPVYPGAVSYDGQSDINLIPSGLNLVAGSATFVVDNVSADTALAWYADALKSDFTVKAGSVNGSAGVPDLTCTLHATPGFTLVVDFVTPNDNPNATRIDYWITDDTTERPQPPQSLQTPQPQQAPIRLSNVTKVVIDYRPVADGTAIATRTVRRTWLSKRVIQAIVNDINQLAVDTRGTLHGCSPVGGGATLHLVTKSGKAVTVQVDFGCNRVLVGTAAPLFDPQNRVWTDISKDMGFKPYLSH